MVALVGLLQDEGTVVILAGIDSTGMRVAVASDRRPAQTALAALTEGEEVELDVQPWQVIGLWGPEARGSRR